jgi:hypothetical protein
MKELIQRLFLQNRFTRLNNSYGGTKYFLLFDSSWAAQEIAFMLSGEWDGCNGVLLTKFDRVAVNTAASLLGASWCYSGAQGTILTSLSVDELKRRYAAGERYFINANFRCANLNNLNLSGINLGWAKLSLANLSEINLSGADLTAACLSNANLTGADLSGANLSLADLSGANLGEANLTEACLHGAKVDRL